MTVDLTGISNENEFYSDHYLDAVFEADIKHVFEKWRREQQDTEKRPPYVLLRGLSREYFVMRQHLERTKPTPERIERQETFLAKLLEALGYTYSPTLEPLDKDSLLPLLASVKKPNGAPELWILEAVDDYGESEDPLSLSIKSFWESRTLFSKRVLAAGGSMLPDPLCTANFDEIITRLIFAMEEPPRWIILCSGNQVVLIDRTRWNEKRRMRFDLNEIFSRREESTFKAVAALLHRDSICPAEGMSLLDVLDEKSHKHAFAVSEDLKYSLRESIELLGNEAVYYLTERRKEKVFEGGLDEGDLTHECLRYMYRLLFIFYIEARPELGYAPMNSDAYRLGYSLDSLRDLETVKLTSEEARQGYYIHESIKLLFDLIYNGTDISQQKSLQGKDEIHHNTFEMLPLKTHLFDPQRTPILNRVRFRNQVLHRVIQLMSLTRSNGKAGRRGRISYAQLGINQLGAVYEALLSYKGFFAVTDLYEVKKADENYDELSNAYFVKAEELDKYTDKEKVYNADGTLKMFKRKSFIYRLAGRDRQKSASYYTPEVLTQCLVKYALKELLRDKSADDILKLTVCEPAMGSAAFLNEAVNQLAEAYLERKQRETGKRIAHDEYHRERQRVKMLLADNNVFGVDLNPVAVELAEVSLFLNTIHEGNFVPWFGLQLTNGNSLIGARRQVFEAHMLETGSGKSSSWLDQVPLRVPPRQTRPPRSVYHFLLPDRGMAGYKDKVIKKTAKENLAKIDVWRKRFTKPFSPTEIQTLIDLSDTIDDMWEDHTTLQAEIRIRTTDPLSVWGQEEITGKTTTSNMITKDRILNRERQSKKVRNSSPYRRLKLVMDYWCSLWFWPIEKAGLLPEREEFLFHLGLILKGEVYEAMPASGDQLPLFSDTMRKEVAEKLKDKYGVVNVENLFKNIDQLKLANELSKKYKFLHWELEYADIFQKWGGFDLVLGNPPWIKVEWNEGGVMGDYQPLFVLRKYSASKLAEMRADTLEKYELKPIYLSAFEESEGTQNFLNAYQNYPVLKGTQSNLYKCFLPQAWMLGNENGISGFLHPEGVYDDPKGGNLRQAVYPKLKYHFQFHNELKLFEDVHHCTKFSTNIFQSSIKEEVNFNHIANLFVPQTIDACFDFSGHGPVPGIKDEEGNWNINGHKERILHVGEKELALFAKLYDTEGTPALQARLPALQTQGLISVLKKFAAQPRRLGDLKNEYFSTEMWHETNAQKDHTIKRETRFPTSADEWILSGPHFFVGNPLYKTPRSECTQNSHYDNLELSFIPDDYLPRTNYVPACSREEYLKRTPRVPWGNKKPVTEYYRLIIRKMLSQSGERTLIPAIIPPSSSHIHGCISYPIQRTMQTVSILAILSSLNYDFFLKTTGVSNFGNSIFESFPLIEVTEEIILRILLLISQISTYSELWSECWKDEFRNETWTKNDPRLSNDFFKQLNKQWHRNCVLRTDFTRRQALVEIDVLTAMALNLTLDELIIIYRIQFPVLQAYEKDTYYDKQGRIVFTSNRGLTGVGLSREDWQDAKHLQTGTIDMQFIDNTLPSGPVERTITYHAPFDNCNREEDYKTAWQEFNKRL